MFCHKCGSQVTVDSAFCPKCGAKLQNDGGLQQVPASTSAEYGQLQTNDIQSKILQKRKLGKLSIIFGAVALVLVVIVVVAIFSSVLERGKQVQKDEECILFNRKLKPKVALMSR